MAGRTFINGKEILAAEDLTLTDDLVVGDDATITDDADIGGTLTLSTDGKIVTTGNGTLTLLPNGTGITIVGDAGSTSHSLATNDDLFVAGKLEVDGILYADARVDVDLGASNSQCLALRRNTATYLSFAPYLDDGAHIYIGQSDGNGNRHLIFTDLANAGKDHDHETISTDPTRFTHSALDPDTRNDEFSTESWRECTIGGSYGSYCGTKMQTEEVTIAVGVGVGSAGVVTSGNLCPANAYIKEVLTRVTQAPGGGATTLDVGRTNGGNLDEAADGTAVALNTTTMANNDGDGNTTFPVWEAGADTLTLTTDADVTVTDMKVRVTVFYEEYTAHTG